MWRPISRSLWSSMAMLGLVGFGFAQPAAAADWTVKPAANHFGADRAQYGYTVNPGGQLGDGIVVANDGAATLRLTVYAADAFTARNGKRDLRRQDAKPVGVGAWVHPETTQVTVPAGESVEVPFSISVSTEATAGDYMGGLVTSRAGERVDVPLRLRVGGALKPQLSVEDVQVRDDTVTYTIHNTGNAILSARQSLSVTGPFGRFAARAGALPDSPALLPGDRWKGSAAVEHVTPAVRLTASVSLVPLLSDAAGSVAPLEAVKGSGHAWAVPWLLLLPLLAICSIGLMILTYNNR
jgi:hypothetical protein